MKHEVLSSEIIKLKYDGTKVTIGFMLDNQDVDEGFFWKEIGIFAEDPDTHEEILFNYASAGETSDFIPAYDESNILERNVDVDIYISDVENITAIIDTSLVYATQHDLIELKEEIDEELDEKFEDLEELEAAIAKIQVKTFSIATNNWTQNVTTQLYEAVISDTSVNSYDNAEVDVDADSYEIAVSAGVKGYVTEVQDTGIKLYAESIPEATITGKYNVQRGVVNG